MGRRSHHASFTQAKRDLKMEKSRSTNDAWKGFLKTWDWWNSQSFQGHCSWPHKGGLHPPLWPPPPPPTPPSLQGLISWRTLGYGLATAIKPDPLWITEVIKSAWMKPLWSQNQDFWELTLKNTKFSQISELLLTFSSMEATKNQEYFRSFLATLGK